jgi:hypothetical protein
MWNRKKILIFALFLNCIYFVGTSFLVTRYVSNKNASFINDWLESGSQAVLDKIIFNSKGRADLVDELGNLDFETKIKDWASAKNIINLIELKDETVKNWIGLRKKVPFDRNQLQNSDDIGFYKNADQMNFNYLLQAKERHFFATQKMDPKDLDLYFEVYGMEITIVQNEGENTASALYTTLPKNTTNELLQKISFDNKQTTPQYVSLDKENYLVKMVDLIPHPPLQQKILFSKKISTYEIVSTTDVLIFIWTFFCISIVLNVVLFKFADR